MNPSIQRCNCKSVEVGSYDNQVEIKDLPPHMALYKNKEGGANSICIDKCIDEEVKYLWSLGITTTGCCCGHNKVNPYIGVLDEDFLRMKELGYVALTDNESSFSPLNNNL